MKLTTESSWDVIVLGAGLAGSLVSTILAKEGFRVLILDKETHPRFAVGESTVHETTQALKILSLQYKIPEIGYLSGYINCRSKVSSNTGIKRNFGFLYHRENQLQNPRETYQVPIAELFEGPEAHYLRQDTDSFLTNTAVHYGAHVLFNVEVSDVQIRTEMSKVQLKDGRSFEARFLIDASGHKSVLADKFQLREEPSRLRTHTRSLFTHMVGVKPYESIFPVGHYSAPMRWSQGTLHHCFDGGWMWVIPFNNGMNPTTPVVSVGLQLDPRKFPLDPTVSAEKEFANFLSKFPSVAPQFEDALAVRPWVRTGRLNYSSKAAVGTRFALLAHAAGFIDPLYSRGLAMTTTGIVLLLEALIPALKADDLSESHFADFQQFQQKALDNADTLVNGSMVAWRDYDLWDAWVRVWLTSIYMGHLHVDAIYRRMLNGDSGAIGQLARPATGSLCPSVPRFQEFFAEMKGAIQSVEDGTCTPRAASEFIFSKLKSYDFFPPFYDIWNPEKKFSAVVEIDEYIELLQWLNYSAPEDLRQAFWGPRIQLNSEVLRKQLRPFTLDETEEFVKKELSAYYRQIESQL